MARFVLGHGKSFCGSDAHFGGIIHESAGDGVQLLRILRFPHHLDGGGAILGNDVLRTLLEDGQGLFLIHFGNYAEHLGHVAGAEVGQ